MTRHFDSRLSSRRTLLQSLGVAGLAGLAGCIGGDSDQDSESTDTADQTPEPTEDPGPDYDVPESEHMDLGQMARDWGAVFPSGNVTSGFSPSQMYEAVDDPDVLRNTAPGLYEVFDFDHRHVPETFIQRAWSNGSEFVKVDQLPGDTTRGGLEESLEEEGFEKVEEKEEFTVYTNASRSEARAVSDNYHVSSFGDENRSEFTIEEYLGQLDTVLNHYESSEMQINDHAQDVLDRLEVSDYLGLATPDVETPFFVGGLDTEKQPIVGAYTGNLDINSKEGVWKFENETFAEEAYSILANGDSAGEYDSVERQGQFVIATGEYLVPNDWVDLRAQAQI